MFNMVCFSCGQPLDSLLSPREPVPRTLECVNCHADVHVCKNCAFYSPGSHWDCAETIPEAVVHKERSNFCDYFKPQQTGAGDSAAQDKAQFAKEAARKKVARLFGDPDDGASKAEGKSNPLSALFSDENET